MAASRFKQQTKLQVKSSWWGFPIYRGLQTALSKSNNRPIKTNNLRIRNRNNYYLLTVIASLLGQPVFANTSSTAAPVAQSSSAVSNQAVQVLNGNLIENQYGNGVVCQTSMLTISPFITSTFNQKRPQDLRYTTPVYNMATDDNGNLTNAGEILYDQENYSANRDSLGVNFGIAATFSIPLSNKFQNNCLRSSSTEQKIREQKLANMRLDHELARLKNCGELKLSGISFSVDSPYYQICKDVVVQAKMGQVIPHSHKLYPETKK